MSTNKKHVLAGILIVGSLAIWIPQLVGQDGLEGSRALDEEFAASAEFVQRGRTPREDAGTFGADAPTRPSPAADTTFDAPAATSDAGASPGRNFAASTESEFLGRLTRAWGDMRPEPVGTGAALAEPSHTPSWAPQPAVHAEAQQFLDEHPLSGILQSQGSSLALFGPRVVREGDELLAGRVVVQTIGRRHVELRLPDRVIRVELPPVASDRAPSGTRDVAPIAPGDERPTPTTVTTPGSQQP